MPEYTPVIKTVNYLNTNIDILRLDLIHPLWGGNKFFKLKYNIQKARENNLPILTFGGAHSNHIFSTAAICAEQGIPCIGIIGGGEEQAETSPTMIFAKEKGMRLFFISREKYRTKTEESFLNELKETFGNFHLVPEGGSNYEAVKGCTEILTKDHHHYDYIFCACGTASTFSGIKISAPPHQAVIGVSVLKGENTLINEANKWLLQFGANPIKENGSPLIHKSTILSEYHFGGYAKFNQELVDFKFEIENWYGVPLDYIYTCKAFYAAFDLLKNKRLSEDPKILIVHTGGLQGNKAYEERYQLTPIL